MSEIRERVKNQVVDDLGNLYESITELGNYLNIWRGRISDAIKKDSVFTFNGRRYTLVSDHENEELEKSVPEYSDEFKEFCRLKDVMQQTPVEFDNIVTESDYDGKKFAIALFSDAHIGKNIDSKTVNGLNEYNVEIAKQRLTKYFHNLVECINKDCVDELIFASLGDGIDGFLRDEDMINSTVTPMEQTMIFQDVVYSGLEYICDNAEHLKKIRFIGIPGNHARSTAKPMHNSSAYKMNYEVMAYRNIEKQCELTNLPIEFHIPESELYIMKIHGKTFGFAHGSFIRGGNSLLSGIYGPVMRTALKYKKLYSLDTLFMGHMHQTVYTTDAILNSSICGYDGFALANAFQYEPPQQSYICYSVKTGLQLLTRQIYVS